MDIYHIYELTIDTKYHFIYCHIDNNTIRCSKNKVIQTCKMLYPFLQKYKNITISIIAQIRSFNELNQPKRFIRENGYHMIQLRNKLFLKELLYIDFYVKQYMMEYGIDNVRGGSYIEDFNLTIEDSSLQNEICYPLRFIKLNEILQEAMEAINELDNKFEIMTLHKIDFTQKKLDDWRVHQSVLQTFSYFNESCLDKINTFESFIPSFFTGNKENVLLLIKSIDSILKIKTDGDINSEDDLQIICDFYKETYYSITNDLDNTRFQIDIESIHIEQVCEMILFYYSSSF